MGLERELKNLKVIEGDLIELTKEGNFDVIVQGCNCFNTQGAGIALTFNKLFDSLSFPMELSGKGDINKLGCIDYKYFYWVDFLNDFISKDDMYNVDKFNPSEHNLVCVVNSYTQYHYGGRYGEVLADYDAIRLVMRKLNHEFKGKRIGLPFIGAGLAKGDPITIQTIMDEELTEVDATLVIYNG